jgi:hypothetical protein
MTANNSNNLNKQAILQNLKDLDTISKKMTQELDHKNVILHGGLWDCQACRYYIDNNRKYANRAK